jgi:tRNA(fMet)-specific endonuclease VapC
VFALDTNTVIYYFKGMGGVAERLLATPPHEVALPSVVVYELERGVLSSKSTKRRAQFSAFLDTFAILPLGRAEAEVAAQLREALEQRGLPIGPLDVLIAGTALAHSATLVTRNLREFSRVTDLKLESWYREPDPG